MNLGGEGHPGMRCAILVALYLAALCFAATTYGSAKPETGQAVMPGQDPVAPVSTFAINRTSAYPLGVTTDASGNVWFAEDNLDALVELVPSSLTTKTFAIPTDHHLAWIWFLVFDESGNLWFSDESQQLIWSFDPATGAFANYTAGAAYPMVIQYDQARGRMWFTSLRTDQVGYFDLAGGKAVLGRVANITAPQPGAGVSGIAIDPAGDAFVAESFQAKIVELDGNTLSVIRTWNLPAGSQPVGLALDAAGGRLWFTDHATSFFGYVDLNSSAIRQYPTSLYFTGGAYAVTLPYWIFVSADGYVWFNEHVANRIARFDPTSQQLTEFLIPANNSSPLMLSVDDQRGVVWFTEFSGNALGMVEENSSLEGSVSDSVAAATAGPTATLTSSSNPASDFPPSVSTTAGSTGEPQPGFEVSVEPKGGPYSIALTAYLARPGNYTAAVCYRFAYSNQCGYVQLVVPSQASALLLYSAYAVTGAGVAALVLVLFLEARKGRRSRPPRDRLARTHPAAPAATAAATATGARVSRGLGGFEVTLSTRMAE